MLTVQHWTDVPGQAEQQGQGEAGERGEAGAQGGVDRSLW